MNRNHWLFYTLLAMLFWGVWGALSELPEKAGFPATLGYCIWALTMLVPALISFKMINWKLETHKKAIVHGLLIGFLGSAGQLILFQALKQGPAFLVFPIVSLSPLVTIFLSTILLKEKVKGKSWVGIIIAMVAIPLLSYQPPENSAKYGSLWILLALVVFFFWGVQAYYMKVANNHTKAESIIVYMTMPCLALIPVALLLTDWKKEMHWDSKWPFITIMIQMLNSLGALFIVYAFRYGKAMVVSPLINTGAPVITIALSLLIYGVFPHIATVIGIILAILAVFFINE